MNRRSIILALCGLAATMGVAAAGSLYKWTDENGVTHFSDTPHPGAESVTLRETSTFTPAAIDTRPAPSAASPADADPEPAAAGLIVSIVSPKPEQTFWNIGGQLSVAVSVQPRLPRGSRVNIYLNGDRVHEGAPGNTAFQLTDVFRGAHNVYAVVEDTRGQEVQRSEPVTFYVQQTAVQPRRAR